MRFCVLGPLEAHGSASAVTIPGGRQRALLALLLMHAGELVTRDRMVDDLWGAPDRASGLDAYLSRLRRALREAGGGDVLRTQAGGYVLAADDTDAADFEARAALGRQALTTEAPDDAADQLRAALSLWRGSAYADVAGEPWARPEAERLEELRLAAVEDRIDAELRLGQHRTLAAEVDLLVARHPTRERLVGQLMLALYRGGRQADALAALRAARTSMIDTLGLEPGRELRELEAAILRQDPVLDLPILKRRATAPVTSRPDDAERKHVTVLVASMPDSDALADELDPELLRKLMRERYSILSTGVHRLGGTVEQFTGDGITALFGAPIALEDHARRGCYAALHLRGELDALRVGLHSGEVVVGSIGEGTSLSAVGRTVAQARRLAASAPDGTIRVSSETTQLVQGYFEVRADELIGITGARDAIDAARARGLSSFVGRDTELHTLTDAFERGRSAGRMVGIVGHAGVGKSRLCHEFLERRAADGVAIFRVVAQSHTRDVPLAPVLGYLRDVFEIAAADTPERARARIEQVLAALPGSFDDDLALVFDFLAVPDPERPVERMDPEARQRRVLGFMRRLGHAYRSQRPTIMLFEDLHWMDAASQTFLASHVDAVPSSPGLTILTFRPEYRPDWMARSYYAQVALDPLGADAVDVLLDEILGVAPSVTPARELIVDRAHGNPFFIEELARALVDSAALEGPRGARRLVRAIDGETVPAGVQAVLAARIDHLAPAPKALLEAAAVLGRTFPLALLTRMLDDHEPDLRPLIDGEYVIEQDADDGPQVTFVHPLTRDVAYHAILAARRPGLHARAATAIERHDERRLDERAALLALHWESAEQPLTASQWHARAALWAGTSDQPQALRQWQAVVELTRPLTGDAADGLRATAGVHLVNFGWRLGMPAAQVQRHFEESEALLQRLDDPGTLALLLFAYGASHGMTDGRWQDVAFAYRRGEQLADPLPDPAPYLAGALGGWGLYCAGDLEGAVGWFQRRLDRTRDPTVGGGTILVSPYAFCLVMQAVAWMAAGQLEQAAAGLRRGRTVALEVGDLEVATWGHIWEAQLAYTVGEPGDAVAHCEQGLVLAERIGSSFSLVVAWFHLGHARLRAGDWSGAIVALERAAVIAEQAGLGVHLAWRGALLAEAHLAGGDVERAHQLATSACGRARQRGQVIESIDAEVALARVCRVAGAAADAQAALTRAGATAAETGAGFYAALVAAEQASLTGDAAGLRAAQHRFTAIGATGHAARIKRSTRRQP